MLKPEEGGSSRNTNPTESRAQLIGLSIKLLQSLLDDAQIEFSTFSNDIVQAASRVSALKENTNETDAENVSASISKLITKMQFSDRFCQRLDNARKSLEILKETMDGGIQPLTDDEYQSLLSKTRESFTSESERREFDVFFGNTLATADSEGERIKDVVFFGEQLARE